jgi:hypothetical protein
MLEFIPLALMAVPAYVLGVFVSIIVGASILLSKRMHIVPSLIVPFVIIWVIFLNVNTYTKDQNKYTILENIPDKFVPSMHMLSDVEDVTRLKYPVILKPVICARTGNDVHKIDGPEEFSKFNINKKHYMIQAYSPYEREVGVLYERMPWEENGRIISIVEKIGRNPIRKWCFGKDKCKNRRDLITHKFQSKIDEISKMIPNFYVGRYDIRYRDDESLASARDFHVVEVNGTMGFDLAKSTEGFFDVSVINQRWFWSRILIGLYNIVSLNGYNPIDLMQVMFLSGKNTVQCRDWEKLFSMYT